MLQIAFPRITPFFIQWRIRSIGSFLTNRHFDRRTGSKGNPRQVNLAFAADRGRCFVLVHDIALPITGSTIRFITLLTLTSALGTSNLTTGSCRDRKQAIDFPYQPPYSLRHITSASTSPCTRWQKASVSVPTISNPSFCHSRIPTRKSYCPQVWFLACAGKTPPPFSVLCSPSRE